MKKSAELVFVSAPAFSHLVGALEFAKRLINRDHRISITFLIMKTVLFAPINSNAYAKSLVDCEQRIKLIDLPEVEFPPPELLKSPEAYACAFIENHKPYVKRIVTDLNSNSVQFSGFVLDFMCSSMIDVANELGLPSYFLVTCNASFLSLVLHLKTRDMQAKSEFKYSDPELVLPSFVNPIPPSVLLQSLFIKESYIICKNVANRLWDAKGIIVNTFMELESYAINSLFDSDHVPPVYAVGPVLNLRSRAHLSHDQVHHNGIMNWLDDQPPCSVVFLCFGSSGGFCEAQVNQIALGLENSGHRFLWSMHDSLLKEKDEISKSTDSENLEDKLPEKVFERTKGRGMICGWTSQTEVLAHTAIGGFISHCGWNSVLESLWFGVPIVTWPLFGEQQLNAFLLVKELGLAMELKLDSRIGEGLVKADEIEKAIRSVLEGDNIVRKRVKKVGENARKAVIDGGSSFNYLLRLIGDMIGK